MPDEHLQRLQRIFEGALERDGEQRRAFVDEACDADARLRSDVETLLRHHDEADSGFMAPAAASTVRVPGPDALVGTRIGDCRIRRRLGAGGMGTVYLAVQEQPRRNVALKIMKQAIASRSALRRFEFEAQILGRLRHPGIAQVYEAGTHDDGAGGVPFFVMEYVADARDLLEYAARKKLGTRERLQLLARICDAVQHGHQKGIIHRDLKPANILVDANGDPKIIDFGVARATDSDLTATTLQTDLRELVGTVQYMSPEQCDGDPDALDVRSDVYSLGVVAYELLAGRPPYDVRRKMIHEATRVIREEEPAPLSTVDRALRGDVETIALKALEKVPDRRYASAGQLGDDIARYLAGEPISARPATVWYVLRTRMRRHRVATGVAAIVFLSAVLTLVWRVQVTRLEERLVVEAEHLIGLVVELAEDKRLRTRWSGVPPDVGILARVESYARNQLADSRLAIAPRLEADLRHELGVLYYRAQMFDDAETQLRRALELLRANIEAPDAAIADSAHLCAQVLMGRCHYEDALPFVEEGLVMRRALYGDEHVDVMKSLDVRGKCRRHLGDYHGSEADRRAALAVHRRLVARGEEGLDEWLASITNNLAFSLLDLGRYEEAESLLADAIRRAETLGIGARFVERSRRNHALCLIRLGRHEAAHERLASLGSSSVVKLHRARCAEQRGDVAAGIQLCRESMATLGDPSECDDRLATRQDLLGRLLVRAGKLAEAHTLLTGALETRRTVYGPAHPLTTASLRALAAWHLAGEDLAAARRSCDEALRSQRAALPGHPETARSLLLRGRILLAAGDAIGATAAVQEALAIVIGSLPAGHPAIVEAVRLLEQCGSRGGRTP